MAYNEELVNRIRLVLAKEKGISEQKAFGGLTFLLDGKMLCGVLKDDLVVRVDPNESDTLLKKPHVRPMDFTGRPMKGFLYVSAGGYKTDKQFGAWLEHCINFVSSIPNKKIRKPPKKS